MEPFGRKSIPGRWREERIRRSFLSGGVCPATLSARRRGRSYDALPMACAFAAWRTKKNDIARPDSGLPTLRIGDLVRDHALMEQARDEARRWLADAPASHPILKAASRSWESRFGLIGVG